MAIASERSDGIREVRLTRRDQQPNNRPDQINRVRAVDGVDLSRKRMGRTLIVLLRSALSAHCGKLVFPGTRQPGVKKQAAGGQCRRMPSIKNLADDLRREECKPQEPGGV